YKTGDLARWTSDGSIEFLGRIDDQLKLHGVRIEPGEIESHINVIPEIVDSVVVVNEVHGDKSLIAYYVSTVDLSVSELRNHLLEELPLSMIPGYYVRLSEMPMTSTGKLDRKSLPSPEGEKVAYQAASTPTEKQLVTLWSELLHLESDQLSVSSSFFDLGGNSLRAVVLINMISKLFSVHLVLKSLFKYQDISSLASYIDSLEKESFIAIPKVSSREYYPLSSAQQRMYFLYEFDKDSLAYNTTKVVSLQGVLDKKKLAASFDQLISRHDVFRTSFDFVDGHPVQLVSDSVGFSITYLEKGEDIRDTITDFISPFDLSVGPLLRVGIISLSSEEHVMIVDNHHIISDGVTNGVLMRDFMSFYRGESLPDLRIQYKDYAVWQQGESQQAAMANHQAYWLSEFKEEVPSLVLPGDYSGLSTTGNQGGIVRFELDAEKTAKLRSLSKEEGTTLFVVLLSIYNVLLSKLCNQEDIVIGTSVAGRHHADLESVAGVFINALALRNYPDGDRSFLEFLRGVNDRTFSSFEHQDYPYEDLIDSLNLKRDTNRNPLFNVMFEYFNFEQPKMEIPGLTLSPFDYDVEVTRFDLTMAVTEVEDKLALNFQYSSSLFRESTIQRFVNYFEVLTDAILGDPVILLRDINVVPLSEQESLIQVYNSTSLPYNNEEGIISVFSRQVQQYPDRRALFFGDNELTYSELDLRSNQVAHYLISEGIVPGNIVGLLFDRSLDMIIGILGVLKSGAGYLPLDPSLPEQRISYMLDQSRAAYLLSHDTYVDDYSAYLPVTSIASPIITSQDDSEVSISIGSTDLAYCIFTSGSSGHPKGVMMPQGSVINLVKGLKDRVYDSYGDRALRVSLLASYSFDASVQQIFGSLLQGHSLYIVDDQSRKDGAALLRFYNDHSIDISDGTPTHLGLLVHSLQEGSTLDSLSSWILAGEVLPVDLVRLFYAKLGAGTQLYNFYGPTETCVDSTSYKIDIDNLDSYDSIPIGKPLPNERVYITDNYGGLVPMGSIGELCIAGDGLALRYVGDQSLTSDKFDSDWIAWEDRVYRTGDLVRWLADGNLEYYGRIDDQVKLRGYRIELSEIAHQLSRYSGITQSVVKIQTIEEEKYVVGYYESSEPLDTSEIRKHLSLHLPEYMIPSYYVHMDRFPLNLSGKIDRKSLPDYELQQEATYVAPTNSTEEKLVGIWSEVLKLDADVVGIDSDFFDLGGHSLKLVFLANKIKKEFNVKISLKEIMAHPTIAYLGEYISDAVKTNHLDILPVDSREYYPLSSAQQRMYFLYEFDKDSLAYNTTKVVSLQGVLDKKKLAASFDQLISRHDVFRTSFDFVDGHPVQLVSDSVGFSITYLEKGEDIRDTITDFISPFDLSVGPLLRVGIISLSSEEHVMIVDNHHIISDGVTNGVLMRDFMSFYRGESLPDLRIQYKDYAVWQQGESQQAAMANHQAYWLSEFKEEVPSLVLPGDYSGLSTTGNQGGIVRFELDAEKTAKLRSLSKEEGTTLFVVLLSIYNVLLSKLCNQEDIVIGTSVAGRHHADLESVAGVFINALALRNYPDGDRSFLEFLRGVNDRTFSSFEHQDYPYEDLIDSLNLKRDTNRNPLFNVMFEYFNFEQPKMEIPGLTLSPFDYDVEVTRFDLTMAVTEVEDKLALNFQYSSSLFRESTIQRFVNYFEVLTDAILGDPVILLRDINVVPLSEQESLIQVYNSTSLPYNNEEGIISVFSRQVQQYPDRRALFFGDNELTYSELDLRSNQVAHYLISEGIVPGNIVGLLFDRSLDMIIGILGVLKSGAGYLPLDPSLPEQRISYMLDQSRAAYLLSHDTYVDDYSAYLPVTSIASPIITSQDDSEVSISIGSTDLAYCIFTSGSSGHPKGVMMPQGSVINLVKGLKDRVYDSYGDRALRVSLLASYSFDASVQQIFGSLLQGHSLYIVDDQSRKDGAALLRFYNDHSIDISDGTPTHLGLLVHSLQEGSTLDSLSSWILAGEVLPVDLVRLFYAKLGAGTQLYNFYGPTETCVDSTSYKIDIDNLDSYDSIPIGKPLPNERVYITDNYGGLVPMGSIGELCIAGDGLALRYVGDQSLTSDKFDSDWIAWEDRVYRTGDLVRWLADGNLEYYGRIDDQVKLRGYRIELSEIAHQLSRYSGITQSVVKIQTIEEEKYVVGYYESSEPLDTSEIRKHLSLHLPEYMIPSYYVHMDRFPLNLSGKIDRKSLPDYELQQEATYVAPTNSTEEKLVEIWSEVLKLDADVVGIDSDFFDLGGHSLNAIQIANSIKQTFEIRLKLVEIFKKRTIRQISELIEMDKWLEGEDQSTNNEKVERKETII
uniref:non-ribosomal peptide synthetase n=1 Tax=Aquimarina sediminis TaxID=2070536 RepID=UPI000FFE569A